MRISKIHTAEFKILIMSILMGFCVFYPEGSTSINLELTSESSSISIYQNSYSELPEEEKLNNLAESPLPFINNSQTLFDGYDFLASSFLCFWQPPKIS